MPYVKGSEVIRIEEGEEIHADTSNTPAFVEAEQAISKALDINRPSTCSHRVVFRAMRNAGH